MGVHWQSWERSILERIQTAGPGSVFMPSDFLDLGTRAAIDQALSRNVRRGVLQRLSRGLYCLPRSHRIWGPIPPPSEAVVSALARRDGLRVAPEIRGPGNSYITDGRSRKVRIGKTVITFKHAAARRMALAALPGGDLVLALGALGRGGAEAAARDRLRGLDGARKAELRAARRLAPAWLSDLLKEHGC